MVAGLPLFKLASLAVKQSAKPVANMLKRGAKESDIFKKYLCFYPGQIYHRLEFHIRMRLMGHTGLITVEPLKENAAVELGAEMLGEFVVFSIGVGVLYAEYRRQKRSEEQREDTQQDNFINLKKHVEELDLTIRNQSQQINKLNKLLTTKSVNESAENS